MSKHLCFGLENTLGTAVAPSIGLAMRPGEGIKSDLDLKGLELMDGGLGLYSDYKQGLATHEGEIEFDLDSKTSGYFFRSLSGGVTTSAVSGVSGAYQHIFLPTGVRLGMTIEQYNDNFAYRYAGCLVNSLKITASEGESTLATVKLLAMTGTDAATAATASYSLGHVYNFTDAASGLKVDDTAIPLTSSVEVEIIANKIAQYGLGSNNPQSFAAGRYEVKGKFVIYLSSSSDVSFYTAYFNQAAKALSLEFTGDQIGETTANESLKIELPKAYYSTIVNPIDNEAARLEVEFVGALDATTQTVYQLTMINSQTSYTN